MNSYLHLVLKNILQAAKNGSLTRDELNEKWPREVSELEPYETILEDVEDAINHVPGFLLKSGIDERMWSTQRERHVILCDLLLLPLIDLSAQEWLSTRATVIQSMNKLSVLNEASIQALVAEFIQSKKQPK